MDRMGNLGNEAGNLAGNITGNIGNVKQMLQGLNFPCSKDDVLGALKQEGAPTQLVDKVRGLTETKFNSEQDLLSKIQGFAGR